MTDTKLSENRKQKTEKFQSAHTPLAEKGELLVAILSMPAVQASFIHAFDLKALQLGTEDVVLAG